MTINGINGVNAQMGQMGMNQSTDPYVRQIQSQIADAQKQLQELSSNEDMSLEEKMKKRQEIQQQISELNMQLRQYQIEQRREKQQEKAASSSDDIFDPNGQSNNSKVKDGQNIQGLSQASMEAMISADTSMKQAKAQGSIATKMEGKAGVLKAEIQLDGARGGDTSSKKQELAETEKKAQEATASQLSTLADTNKTMKEAAEADRNAEKSDGSDINAKEKDTEESISGVEGVNKQSGTSASENASSAETAVTPNATTYVPVDVRL
ncbi:MAG: FlxA-like family protein [Lachnospiraceae bacterium]|nr:FlxA-like family protein [Lachnospiraceae bacterium]